MTTKKKSGVGKVVASSGVGPECPAAVADHKKLDPAFKAKWVKALRSGKYRQGKSFLYNSGLKSYCCLGVAGRLCRVPLRQMDFGGWSPVAEPLSARGLDSGWPTSMLIAMNDRGESFAEIADYIEKSL